MPRRSKRTARAAHGAKRRRKSATHGGPIVQKGRVVSHQAVSARSLDDQLCARCFVTLTVTNSPHDGAGPGTPQLCNTCLSAMRREEQEAQRALHPSVATESGWIWSHECPSLTDRRASPWRSKRYNPGKWLLFVTPEDVDEVWHKIVRAEQEGRLGDGSKVSTATGLQSPRANNRKHVIVVYTRDHEDEADVMRVRDELRQLGFVAPIAYKTDQATLEGRYQGDGRVAKWFV